MILVLCDSLAYYGPKGGLPANDARIWPNVLAIESNKPVELVGRIGWTARDAWWALTQDPRIWSMLPDLEYVILAIGGMDSLPSPLPTAVRELIRYIRPDWLRRKIRTGYGWLQKKGSSWGWPQALPPGQTVKYLNKIMQAISQVNPKVKFIATLPAVHASAGYNFQHPGKNKTSTAIATWSSGVNIPVVDLSEIVQPFFANGDYNPDGIHWGFAAHKAVADSFKNLLTNMG